MSGQQAQGWALTGELPAIRDNDPPEWSGVDVLFSADAYVKDYTIRHRRITYVQRVNEAQA